MLTPADISFIIPAFNCRQYLPDLKQSLEQQEPLAYRVICIDDGSYDGTGELFDRWAQADDRYHVIHQANGGLSSARNAGLAYLKQHGELQSPYLMFIDADDKIAPLSIQAAIRMANDFNLDVLYFSAAPDYESESLRETHPGYMTYYQRTHSYEGVFLGLDYLAATEANGEFLPSAALQIIRTSFLIENGISFFEGIIHEDNLFTAQCLIAANRVAYLDEPIYLRRIREGSIVTTPISEKNVRGYFTAGVEILKWTLHHAGSLNHDQEEGIERFIYDMFGAAYERALHIPNPDIHFRDPFERVLYNRMVLERVYQERNARQQLVEEQNQRTKEVNEAVKEIENWIRSSTTWRIGDTITKIPRKIKALLNSSR